MRYCNLILEKGEEMTEPGNEIDPSFNRSDWNIIKSEVLSLRALYYFDLVRAYRNVPFVTKAIRTDKEASAEKPAATSGSAILGELISELESVVNVGAENYGSTSVWSHSLLCSFVLRQFVGKTAPKFAMLIYSTIYIRKRAGFTYRCSCAA